MSNGPFSSLRGLLQNPIQSYRDARQPGGLLAPVTSMNQFLGDPRVNVGLAIASGNPIGDALLQSAQIQEALAPAELSDREIRLNDYMETFGVDRATAIKIDKGLLAPSTNEKGEPITDDDGRHIYAPRMVVMEIPTWEDGVLVQKRIPVPLQSLTTGQSLRVDTLEVEISVEISGLTADKKKGKLMVRPCANTPSWFKKENNAAKLKLIFKGSEPPEGYARIDDQLIKLLP